MLNLARRLPPRFSLLTILLLLTIAAMAFALWQLHGELAPLRADVRRMRRELGFLTIDDPNKIYAIQVASPNYGIRRYRVYLPEHRRFQIQLGFNQIAGRKPGRPRADWLKDVANKRSGSSGDIASGEFTIDIEVSRDLRAKSDDQWNLTYRVNNAAGGTVGTQIPWLNDSRLWAVSSEAPLGEQIEQEPAEGLVLFTLRQSKIQVFDGGHSSTPPDTTQDAPGLIAWITLDDGQ